MVAGYSTRLTAQAGLRAGACFYASPVLSVLCYQCVCSPACVLRYCAMAVVCSSTAVLGYPSDVRSTRSSGCARSNSGRNLTVDRLRGSESAAVHIKFRPVLLLHDAAAVREGKTDAVNFGKDYPTSQNWNPLRLNWQPGEADWSA